eukprot:CAMPEP_0181395354 /NCGR_PEP_ID=MMETSP1106-20121128/28291_1 /TAXON_ID=81844 /ORGANISM="Mantoniella antarctica, Strain SL-175" /LENGTH=151 /DNA_ID=CAMNT_0023516961 /DNA_START=146 /DNA_END=602 /DNA_ORIENTATION=-
MRIDPPVELDGRSQKLPVSSDYCSCASPTCICPETRPLHSRVSEELQVGASEIPADVTVSPASRRQVITTTPDHPDPVMSTTIVIAVAVAVVTIGFPRPPSSAHQSCHYPTLPPHVVQRVMLLVKRVEVMSPGSIRQVPGVVFETVQRHHA